MNWLKALRGETRSSAQTAKERLKLVVMHQRDGRTNGPAWLPRLREDLLAAVRRYTTVADSAVHISIQRDEGIEVLEMNITLQDP